LFTGLQKLAFSSRLDKCDVVVRNCFMVMFSSHFLFSLNFWLLDVSFSSQGPRAANKGIPVK
jgi:hypothetical protein